MDKNNKKISDALGTIMGNVVVACMAVCAVAIVLAITLKFITWLF